jgi:hypothetical protein
MAKFTKYRRLGTPLRNVVSESRRGFRGFHWSRTMGCHIQYESMIEYSALVLMECDWRVKIIHSQPERVPVITDDGVTVTTPDFAICRDGKWVIVECKPQKIADRPEWQQRFEQIKKFYAPQKVPFEVWTDEGMKAGHKLDTCELMLQYDAEILTKEGFDRLSILSDGPKAVGRVLEEFADPLDGQPQLAAAFLDGLISLDFDRPFSNDTQVSLNNLELAA